MSQPRRLRNAKFQTRPRNKESAGQKEKGKAVASYGGAVVGETETEERTAPVQHACFRV